MMVLLFISTNLTLCAATILVVWPPYRPMEMLVRLSNAATLCGVLFPFLNGWKITLNMDPVERATFFLGPTSLQILSVLFCVMLWKIRLRDSQSIALVFPAASSVGMTFFLIQNQLLRTLLTN